MTKASYDVFIYRSQARHIVEFGVTCFVPLIHEVATGTRLC